MSYPRFPLHEAFQKRLVEYEAIVDFLTWLSGYEDEESRPALCSWREVHNDHGKVVDYLSGYVAMNDRGIARLICQYFGIDIEKFEKERKDACLCTAAE